MTTSSQAVHEEHRLVRIPAGGVVLEGELAVPPDCRGLVLFAHGSGSSRHSPRNRFVARSLRADAGVGTLLMDLLSPDEEAVDVQTRELRFDIPFLAERLVAATDWLAKEPEARGQRMGYFGASTGAAAALVAAAERPRAIAAIVSRGGRPDLAADVLDRVQAPTLFIVGGEDYLVLDLNRSARSRLRVESELEVVPNASHLFEEPGALGDVATRAARWFARWLAPGGPRATTQSERG